MGYGTRSTVYRSHQKLRQKKRLNASGCAAPNIKRTLAMALSLPTAIKTPSGPLNVIFGEATSEQRLQWCQVVTAAFAPSLPASALVEHEEYLSQHPLTVDQGTRFWSLSLVEDSRMVLAVCKTIRRRFLIRDIESVSERDGYCIGYVATHPDYRRLGLATLLIKQLASWLDGPANATASMLYTSVGDFYVSQGWEIIPSVISNITNLSIASQSKHPAGLPSTRLLTNKEIPALCLRDVADLRENFEKLSVSPDEVHLAVLPSPEMVTWLHEWGDFLNNRFRGGQAPYVHGAICEAADTWLYWHYGFKHLAISRVVGKGPPEVLAALLIDALAEASKWDFPKVVVWEPNPDLINAMDLLSKKIGIEVETIPRPNSVTSLRWKGSDNTKKTTLHLNEVYASC
ncbi:hypothetical protein V8C35DRAFT_318689 [Trichoderma chlorosporum]